MNENFNVDHGSMRFTVNRARRPPARAGATGTPRGRG
jgi:hypothetical protein